MPQVPGLDNQCGYCHLHRKRLMICSGCRHDSYCNKTCQKADWPHHRKDCYDKRQARNQLKEAKSTHIFHGLNIFQVSRLFTQWIQVHQRLLSKTLIHSLNLLRNPDRCLTHAFHAYLRPNFDSSCPGKTPQELASNFLIEAVRIYTIEEVLAIYADREAHQNSLNQCVADMRDIRVQGHCGVVSIVHVLGSGLTQMIPIVIDKSVLRGSLRWNPDWERELRLTVAMGIVTS